MVQPHSITTALAVNSEPVSTHEEIPIEGIAIGDRRTLNQDKVRALAESIKEIGLQHPIGVTEEHRLVHGLHRIEAYKLLGWKTIPAMIHQLEGLRAELAEIDENIQRSTLTTIEEAEALKRRKEIFESLHPEAKSVTKRGGPGRGKKTMAKMATVSFAEDTAKKTGKGSRTIRRYVGIAASIAKDLRKQIKNTPICDKQKELENLGQLPESEQRSVVAKLVSGEAKSVAKAVKLIDGDWSWQAQQLVIAKFTRDYLMDRTNLLNNQAFVRRLADLRPAEQRQVARAIVDAECQTSAAEHFVQHGVVQKSSDEGEIDSNQTDDQHEAATVSTAGSDDDLPLEFLYAVNDAVLGMARFGSSLDRKRQEHGVPENHLVLGLMNDVTQAVSRVRKWVNTELDLRDLERQQAPRGENP